MSESDKPMTTGQISFTTNNFLPIDADTIVSGKVTLPTLSGDVEFQEGDTKYFQKLHWSDHRSSNEDCGYDHVIAETPLGPLYIEWKSWKSYPSYTCYLPWDGAFVTEYSLDDAKAAVHKECLRIAWLMRMLVGDS